MSACFFGLCNRNSTALPVQPEGNRGQDTQRLQEIQADPTYKRYTHLPQNYAETFSLPKRIIGIAAFCLVSIIVISWALLVTNQFHHVMELAHNFTSISLPKLAIGLNITAVMLVGTAWVIHRARGKEDPLVEGKIFHSVVELEEAVYEDADNPGTKIPVYIDKSTLDSEGNGKAYLYGVKTTDDHYSVSTVVSLATPFYMITTLVYHTLRLFVVPFYVAGCLVIEQFREDPLFHASRQRKFKVIDILYEPWKSLKQVVSTPFYASAFLFAAFYSLFKPIEGRILGSKIERDWNLGNSRATGYWSTQGRQSLWKGWQELGPEKLGCLKFFLAGCWQPVGVVRYENGSIAEGMSLSKAVEGDAGHVYNVYSKSQLTEEGGPQLVQEHREILQRNRLV